MCFAKSCLTVVEMGNTVTGCHSDAHSHADTQRVTGLHASILPPVPTLDSKE